jgi:hypothetical protein
MSRVWLGVVGEEEHLHEALTAGTIQARDSSKGIHVYSCSACDTYISMGSSKPNAAPRRRRMLEKQLPCLIVSPELRLMLVS